MTIIVYLLCLLSMMLVMYVSGKGISKSGNIYSRAGFMAVVVYTLNEGLRYGRGIDYNLYYSDYMDLAAGKEDDSEPVFAFIREIFISLGLPYQALIIFMSFMFIWSLLTLIQNYRNLMPLALPLFVFFSISEVENMVRWYLAFSFFLFGLSDLIKKEKLSWKYFVFSLVGSTIHFAFLPIPIVFYIVFRFKQNVIKPYISIPLFFVIYYTFESDTMSQYVDFVNIIVDISGDRFASYGDRAEYWLTGGFSGEDVSGIIDKAEIAFLLVLTMLGYRIRRYHSNIYSFAYNLFIIGFLLLPIAKKVELVIRYDSIFYFFRSIVMAAVIYTYYIQRRCHLIPIVKLICMFLLLYAPFKTIVGIILDNPKRYLYVWDKQNMTPDKMLQLWKDELHNSVKKQD